MRSETATEVSLVRTVNKIRRYNFKHKEKRARNKLRLLSTASESLSYVRLEFLIQDSTEDSNIEDENELNRESEQIEMAYESLDMRILDKNDQSVGRLRLSCLAMFFPISISLCIAFRKQSKF